MFWWKWPAQGSICWSRTAHISSFSKIITWDFTWELFLLVVNTKVLIFVFMSLVFFTLLVPQLEFIYDEHYRPLCITCRVCDSQIVLPNCKYLFTSQYFFSLGVSGVCLHPLFYTLFLPTILMSSVTALRNLLFGPHLELFPGS